MEAWKIIHPLLRRQSHVVNFIFIRIQKIFKICTIRSQSSAVYFMPLKQSCVNQNICLGTEQPLCWLTWAAPWNAHMWVKWKVEPQGLICSCRLLFFPLWGRGMLILKWGHFIQVIKCLICNHWDWSLERLWPGDQRELHPPAGLWFAAAGGSVWRGTSLGLLWPPLHLPGRAGGTEVKPEFSGGCLKWNLVSKMEFCCDTEQESLWVATLSLWHERETHPEGIYSGRKHWINPILGMHSPEGRAWKS